MPELKLVTGADVAEAEFDRFIAAMDIDADPKGMDDADKASLLKCRRTLVAAIQSGQLVINEAGEPVFRPKMGGDEAKPITFREPSGATFMAMDQKKEGHNIAKMYAVLAEMSGQPIQTFAKMAGRDVKICQAIFSLFLG